MSDELKDLNGAPFEVEPEPERVEPAKTKAKTKVRNTPVSKEETIQLLEKRMRDPNISPEMLTKLTRTLAKIKGWNSRREIVYKGATGRKNQKRGEEDALPGSPQDFLRIKAAARQTGKSAREIIERENPDRWPNDELCAMLRNEKILKFEIWERERNKGEQV
jgi:hypothetical protein